MGIFRVCASASVLKKLKGRLLAPGGEEIDLEREGADADVAAGLLKSYYREADEPLFPESTHAPFLAAFGNYKYKNYIVIVNIKIIYYLYAFYFVLILRFSDTKYRRSNSEVHRSLPAIISTYSSCVQKGNKTHFILLYFIFYL